MRGIRSRLHMIDRTVSTVDCYMTNTHHSYLPPRFCDPPGSNRSKASHRHDRMATGTGLWLPIRSDDYKQHSLQIYECGGEEKASAMDAVCASCQSQVSGKFCEECGTEYTPPVTEFCPQCGNPSSQDARFCRRCGFALRDGGVATQRPPSAPPGWTADNQAWGNPNGPQRFLPPPPPPAQNPASNGLSIAAIVCGAVAFLLLPVVFGPIAIITGAVAWVRGERLGPVGVAVGVCGLIIGMFLGAVIWSAGA